MEFLSDVILDTGLDCLKMLPFLFVAFLLIEALEHYSGGWTARVLARVGKAGPVVGTLAGLVPQCGFSVMASNLYAGGVISLGTLISAFVATSDEAVLIMVSNPGQLGKTGALLFTKAVIAVAAGYVSDLFFAKQIVEEKQEGGLCRNCGCHEEHAGIFMPAWRHTVQIFLYLLLFTGILNLAIEMLGIEQLSAFLLGNSILQPVMAAVIGFIPNCAGSVILTQLYLNGAISFGSVVAGLCTGTGVAVVVLFKVNRHRKENVKIMGLVFGIAVLSGVLIGFLPGI